MSKKQQNNAAREAARRSANLSRESEAQIGTVSALAAASDLENASRWPLDVWEMAQRITREGERAVPSHDRELIARNLPAGTLTRRDGSSIRPCYRDLANA